MNADARRAMIMFLCIMAGIILDMILFAMNANGIIIDEMIAGTITIENLMAFNLVLWMLVGGVLCAT